MFIAGNTGILKICLNVGTHKMIIIKAADTTVAKINFLLLKIPVLKMDFLFVFH